MIVLVTGVSGLLGINLSLQLAAEHSVFGVYHRNPLIGTPFDLICADLTDEARLYDILALVKPDIIFNCAALANLDRCEEDPKTARHINTVMPGILAEASNRMGIRMVHISTDAVFDGVQGGYREDDIPNPLSVYAQTKFLGEQQVQEKNPKALIARVNFYGCSLSGARSLAEWFLNNLSAGNKVMGFTDVFFCPLFVDDLVQALWQMTARGLSGLYHVVGSECLSKYQFGVSLARQFELDEKLIAPSSWQNADLKALRSPNLCLDTQKVRQDLGVEMPGLANGLAEFQKKIEHGFSQKVMSFANPTG